MDLGFAMTRHWLLPVYLSWWLVLLPVFVVVQLACWQAPWAVPLVLWWLKPLLDRVPLVVLSRALFGDAPRPTEIWCQLPRLLGNGWLRSLSLGRLDPARSFHLPVTVLEGSRGRERRQRRRQLGKSGLGAAIWLTLTCGLLELAIYAGLIGALWLFLPGFMVTDFFDWLQNLPWLEQLLFNAMVVIVMGLVEPCYVAAGFALYLNRRTWLEAWDLEIGFRRLGARLASTLLLVSLLGLVGLESSHAQDNISPFCQEEAKHRAELSASDDPVAQALAEILAENTFQRCQAETILQWPEEELQLRGDSLPLGGLFADGMAIVLWLLFGGALALLVVWLVRRLPTVGGASSSRTMAAPVMIHGETIRPEAPAADTPQRAWQLWESGERRAGLALLYRASLAALLQRGVELGANATESEALQRTASQLPDDILLPYLDRLTRVWQELAYAHRPPTSATVQDLCQDWPHYFQIGGES